MPIAVTRGVGPDSAAPPCSSGISVIIVGCGYAGITAAIECHRKGHHVTIFERTKEIGGLGDTIGISQNGALVLHRWGIHPLINAIACDYKVHSIHSSDGEFLHSTSMKGYSDGTGYVARRGDVMAVLYSFFKSLGLSVHLDSKVEEYFETPDYAGVIVNGQKYEADAVLVADGVHSRGRDFCVGQRDPAKPTGYAIFRAWFIPQPSLRENPATAWLALDGEEDSVYNFIGPKTHTLLATVNRGRGITWVCTHADEEHIEESWTQPAKLDDALKVVEGWDPRVAEVYRQTTPDQLFDQKLLYRDPLPNWTSKEGRVLLIGDAAHSFVPTSAQGATQAIEDAASIAIILELAGKTQIPLALRTLEKMRYDRTSIAQKMGVQTRETWVNTDWDAVKKNPEVLAQPRPQWLFGHDPQVYAYEEFEAAANAVLTGCEYKPRNVPKEGENPRGGDFDEKRLT